MSDKQNADPDLKDSIQVIRQKIHLIQSLNLFDIKHLYNVLDAAWIYDDLKES